MEKKYISDELKRIYKLWDKEKLDDSNDESGTEGFWDFACELMYGKAFVKEDESLTNITMDRDELWSLLYWLMVVGYELKNN